MAVLTKASTLRKYKDILNSTTEISQVLENYPELKLHYEVLISNIDKILLLKTKRTSKDICGQFVMHFRRGFEDLSGSEYSKDIGKYEMGVIWGLCNVLKKKSILLSEYLDFMFKEYYPKNTRMMPPSIKFLCGDFALNTYTCLHRDFLRNREKTIKKSQEEANVIGEVKKLARSTKDKENKKYLIGLLDSYNKGTIGIKNLTNKIEKIKKEGFKNVK